MRDYPETMVTFKGTRFCSPDYRDVPPEYLIVTDDDAIAEDLGFGPAAAGERYRFERWVGVREADQVVQTFAYGLCQGEPVAVLSESDDRYVIESSKPLPGLEQVERFVYVGQVEKGALERFWTESKAV